MKILTWFLSVFAVLISGIAQAQSAGTLRVQGEAGKFQIFSKVKAVRCSTQERGKCAEPIYFSLNTSQSVPAGSYLVGFENSIFPDLVDVQPGAVRTLQLERIDFPTGVEGTVRIYRDFSSLIEQNKMYLTMFYMNRHFFRLEEQNFGDLYLTGSWERDFIQRFTYEICPKIGNYRDASDNAVKVCGAWNSARTPIDLRLLYNFAEDGTLHEMWVTYPGDVIPSKHPRYLVSVPLSSNDFVAVFPGAYVIQAEGKNQKAHSVKVGPWSHQNSSNFSLNTDLGFISLGEGTSNCSQARLWMTDKRAYCKKDSQEGCHRSTAVRCEDLE